MHNGPTLTAGNFSIESASNGFDIYVIGDFDEKTWVATTLDPELAMKIVEGLILVDMKRFYHPDSAPTMKSVDSKPLPPFLKKGD